jgi:hypothetical protein
VGQLVGDEVELERQAALGQVVQLQLGLGARVLVRIDVEVLPGRAALHAFNDGHSYDKVVADRRPVERIYGDDLGAAGDVGELELLALGHDHAAAGPGTVGHGQLQAEHLARGSSGPAKGARPFC